MYTINYVFKGGPEWDQSSPSLVHPGKTKSGLEHLVTEQGLTLDMSIELLSYLRSLPIKIYEDVDPNYPGATVVFHFDVEDEELKNNIVYVLENSKSAVGEGYEMLIDVKVKND